MDPSKPQTSPPQLCDADGIRGFTVLFSALCKNKKRNEKVQVSLRHSESWKRGFGFHDNRAEREQQMGAGQEH